MLKTIIKQDLCEDSDQFFLCNPILIFILYIYIHTHTKYENENRSGMKELRDGRSRLKFVREY